MSFLFLIVLIGVVVYFVKSYNNLQRMAQEVQKWHANVLATLQKYTNSINKLQELLQGYADHEKLIYLRTSDNLVEMTRQTANALANIQNMVQSYPDIKANESYRRIMNEVSNIQDQINQCRFQYNEAVAAYNGRRKSIPEALYASSLGFQEAPFYDPDKIQEAKEFTTDDGTLVREMLKKGTKNTVAAVKNVTDNISHTIDETMEAKANEDAKQRAIKEEDKK